jgi:primosomal protein N' (replication factor Y)
VTRYVRVALPVPLRQVFTYEAPGALGPLPGCRVRVPFGARRLVGLCVEADATLDPGLDPAKVRPIETVLDPSPILSPELVALSSFIADYYLAAPGEALLLPLPGGLSGDKQGNLEVAPPKLERWVRKRLGVPLPKRLGARQKAALNGLTEGQQVHLDELQAGTGVGLDTIRRLEALGLVDLEERQVARDPFHGARIEPEPAPVPTGEQAGAIAAIREALGQYQAFLLHGVTGSGKTEVYLTLIDEVLRRGLGAITLVPEIALTPQLVARYRGRLGDRIAVLHSGLAQGARQEQWLRIATGELPVVIGARSALFAPVPKLGILVVDEEHEPSFKQDRSPRYHARDVALVRARLAGCPVVLGSATPSLESWANAERGKLRRLNLSRRARAVPLPEVEHVDMREAEVADEEGLYSRRLAEAIAQNVSRGEQTILFLNRRGWAAFVLCRACGQALSCPACAVTLTWHRAAHRLTCHYCDHRDRLPPRCPACEDDALQEMGFGTERAEDVLRSLLEPGARVARMDRDTTRGPALEKLLDRFRRREIDVLVGTQMVAKGHDFPGVTLCGVLCAEQSLRLPDPRAAERTFQLLTQIAGRAGRADKPGRVLVQTYCPEHYALTYAARHDAEGYAREELARRQEQGFPPWSHLALLRLTGADRPTTFAAAQQVASAVDRAILAHPGAGLAKSGPQAAPIERLRGEWRVQILVRARDRTALHATLAAATTAVEPDLPRAVQLAIDVDPIGFL